MVKGYCGDKWARVAEAFAGNFTYSGEQGAGFALVHRGELVVNIWGGKFDNRLVQITAEDWREDTCVNIFSAAKGLVALCVLRLVADGRLALDKPIADYWPEFAQSVGENLSKKAITLRQVLCHRSGLSAFHQHIPDKAIFDWEFMVHAVAAETPWWQPNTAQGYSPFIFGWVLGELVSRASGSQSFDEFFQREVAQGLVGVNCYFGVPNEMLASVADVAPLKIPVESATAARLESADANSVTLGKVMKSDPRGVTNQAFCNPISLMTAINSQEWRQAQIPAANAHTNAQALATIYGALANGGEGLIPASHLPLCWQEQSFAHDQVLDVPLRFSNGFMLSQHDRLDCRYGRNERGFGHPGAGGCLGFADPEQQLGFGYVTNRMGRNLLIDERARHLIDVVYKVLEG